MDMAAVNNNLTLVSVDEDPSFFLSTYDNASFLTTSLDSVNNISSITAILGSSPSSATVRRPPDGVYNAFVRVIMIVYGILFFGGLMNIVVLVLIPSIAGLRTVNNVSIFHISLASLLYSCGLPFVVALYYYGEWVFGHAVCKIVLSVEAVSKHATMGFIALAAMERYVAVCHHQLYQRYFTMRAVNAAALIAWSLITVSMSPVILYSREYIWVRNRSVSATPAESVNQTLSPVLLTASYNKTYCVVDLTARSKLNFLSGAFICLFLIPAVGVIYSYYSILRRMSQSRKKLEGRTRAAKSNNDFASCDDGIRNKKSKQHEAKPTTTTSILSRKSVLDPHLCPHHQRNEDNSNSVGEQLSAAIIDDDGDDGDVVIIASASQKEHISLVQSPTPYQQQLSQNLEQQEHHIFTDKSHFSKNTNNNTTSHQSHSGSQNANHLHQHLLKKHMIQQPSSHHPTSRSAHLSRSVTTMILCLIGCYLVSWSPYWLLNFLSAHKLLPNGLRYRRVILNVFHLLPYISCSSNPVLYVFMTKHFRMAIQARRRQAHQNRRRRQK